MKMMYKKIYQKKLSLLAAKKVKDEIINFDRELSSLHKDLYFADKKVYNKFFFEFVPLVFLAEKLGATSLTLMSELDEHQGYDAELHFENKTEVKVEFVTAMFHQEERLRIEHAKKYGYAPFFKESPRNEIEERLYREDELSEMIKLRLVPLIIENFDKKCQKQKNGAYQNNTILGIIIDDAQFDEKLLRDSLLPIEEYITKSINKFVKIILIGNDKFFKQIK